MTASTLLSLLFLGYLLGQKNIDSPTPTTKKSLNVPTFYLQRAYPDGAIHYGTYQEALRKAQELRQNCVYPDGGRWQLVGPMNIGGRVTDVEMHPSDTVTMYVAAASGGIFKSNNGGESWRPIFDEQLSLSIGDMAIAASDKERIYVGTGEANGGGGSITYDGIGVFKSLDAGENWVHIGLEDTRNIGRIVVHPTQPDTLWVGAMGALFESDSHRGVYRSRDGGDNWERVLFVSDSTGCADLAMHPKRPNTIFASLWERNRNVYARNYGGKTSALYRSKDGGDTWKKLTNGLPRDTIGRIGVAVAPSNPNVVYAVYAGEKGYFAGVYRSKDGGEHWTMVHDHSFEQEENFFASYGWWFGRIYVDPIDEDKIYALGLDIYKSEDGGEYWKNISTEDVHVDQHALYIHPQNPDFLLLGNDGGVNWSRDQGETWTHSKALPITQFYTCAVSQQLESRIYGGSQDNGILGTKTGEVNDWQVLIDGDGFKVLVDPTDFNKVYGAYQYGSLYTSNDGGFSFREAIRGISWQDRKNWNAPVEFHPNNPSRMYFGANKIYLSENAGKGWRAISPDLSKKSIKKSNDLIYGTITAIAPTNSALIYAGTDDGNIWLSSDNGLHWKEISEELPDRWVTHIAVNPNDAEVTYVSLSGYRAGDVAAHIYKTTNSGATWQNIADSLPKAPINDIIVDQKDTATLFIATDIGVFVNRQNEESWQLLGNNLPNVVVTDIDLNWRTRTLFAATYGRSIYKYNLKRIRQRKK